MPIGSKAVLTARSQATLSAAAVNPGTLAKVLVPVDFRTDPFTAREDGTGFATVTVPRVDVGQFMQVERISVLTNSAAATNLSCYVGSVAPENRVDYTPGGNDDIADENNPILVPGGSDFILQWQSMSAGAQAWARVQYRVSVPVRQAVG